MLQSKMQCDGCGRKPKFMEWVRGELTADGYPEWRHPGICFKAGGCAITHNTRARAERFFYALFQRQLPDESGFLCPECQAYAAQELPSLCAQDPLPGDATYNPLQERTIQERPNLDQTIVDRDRTFFG